MNTATAKEHRTIEDLTLEIKQEIHVKASLEKTFAALLEQLGPRNERVDGTPMPLKLEAWPGGRWYRDLGDGNGHLWAHVQAIKKPTLLEFCGPLFMSYPGLLEFAIPAEGTRRWNADRVPSHGARSDHGRASHGSRDGLGTRA